MTAVGITDGYADKCGLGGHENTGYPAASESGRRPAGEVVANYKTLRAVIALEDEMPWDPAWGALA